MKMAMSRILRAAAAGLAWALASGAAEASDHLDSPAVIADPRIDIGDLYAWMAPDGAHLNVLMSIVGHSFSDTARYVFHFESGPRFGQTRARLALTCRFPSPAETDCRLSSGDHAIGDARDEAGLASRRRSFRVFAGMRNDPFFNNVRGTRAAYQIAMDAIEGGLQADGAGCPALPATTSGALLDAWRHTDGAPGRDFLAGWTPSVIAVSLDLLTAARGGPLLAVWASTEQGRAQVDRAGRPLTGNALLGTLASAAVRDRMKEDWNGTIPQRSARFAPLIAEGLAFYDGFDGCGNQWLADRAIADAHRYETLAALLADDRLWVNSAARVCTTLFAVERVALGGEGALAVDCGGRAPTYDSVNVYRSLLVDGRTASVDDGVHRDEGGASDSAFPFAAAARQGDAY